MTRRAGSQSQPPSTGKTMTMNTITHDDSFRAADTYDAAAKDFDAVPFAFWDRFGKKTVEHASLRIGSRVLDVGCGTGASAIPAAIEVGSEGYVTGVDIADGMLQEARNKAFAARVDNISFEKWDMTRLPFDECSFDAVISVFSIFFVEDMVTTLNGLWRLIRPGGTLAVTVWAEGAFEPAGGLFLEEVRRVRPELPEPNRPWQRLTEASAIHDLFQGAIGLEPELKVEPFRPDVSDPADWWGLVLGSGYRWFVQRLKPSERDKVKVRYIERMCQESAQKIELGAVVCIVRKP